LRFYRDEVTAVGLVHRALAPRHLAVQRIDLGEHLGQPLLQRADL
jgi:hypothetical protein